MKKICIVGAGPSGLFCAHRIKDFIHQTGRTDLEIIILERGKAISDRLCPAKQDGICRHCPYCSILSGGGGAGLFSDGKMIQDLSVGGDNATIASLSSGTRKDYISHITETLLQYDGVSQYKGKPDGNIQEKYKKLFSEERLSAKYYDVLHMGSSNLIHILDGFIDGLIHRSPIQIKYETFVTHIALKDEKYQIYAGCDLVCTADYVVMAVGKSGASWLQRILSPMGVGFRKTGFYFGLRVEMPQKYLKPLSELSFDPKIYRELGEDRKIKMHCFCRKGKVIMTNCDGYAIVGGHSPYTEKNERFSEEGFGNFNILLSYPKPDEYAAIAKRFKAAAADTLLVQTLGDFRQGKITDPQENAAYLRGEKYQTANIRAVVADSFFSEEFMKFIDSLNHIFPGIGDDNNLLYGPAFEWCMDKVQVSECMETALSNLFAVGDGAGLSQGIVYSAATGIIAAESIIERVDKLVGSFRTLETSA